METQQFCSFVQKKVDVDIRIYAVETITSTNTIILKYF
jgi:hypothetical protein